MAQTAQPADITAVQAVLKEVYTGDKLEEQVVNDRVLLSQIEKTTDYTDSVGDKAIGFVRTQGNVRSSARSLNGGTLGAAGRQERKRWEYDYKANYIQVKILGTTIAKMKTARQAAVREVDDEISNAVEDLKDDLQRQLYGNGDALIAQAAAVTTNATVPLNAVSGATAIEKGWLAPNMYVDIGTTADEDAVVADALISAVNQATPSITIDSAVTTTTSHYVSRADNRSGTTSYEMNGLANLTASSGTFGGLTTSSTPLWAGNVVSVGGALSQAKMQDGFVAARKKGAKPDLIITSFEHQRDYYNLLQAQVRFAGDKGLSSGHLDGPDFNGIAVVADQDCPDGVMYFLSRRHLMMFTASGGVQWQNVNTGGDVLDWVQDEDAFAARAAFYGEFGTNRRNAHVALTGIT